MSQGDIAARQPPLRPRVPLTWRGAAIGSVEPDFLDRPALRGMAVRDGAGWSVTGHDLTASLQALALALRAEGLAHVWRDEQLGVDDVQGRRLGSVERGVVRVLGIPTAAVHLAGWSEGGDCWLQQRAFDKPTDPGLWDTLMGGMISANDSLQEALARETWEEAGLTLDRLQDLVYGGCIETSRPATEVPHGYLVERLHWFRCVLPAGVVPSNQDGEVAQFAAMPPAEVRAGIARGEFTQDAAWILRAAGLAPA